MGGVYENAPGTQRGNEKVSNMKRRLADTRLEYLAVRELKRIGCGSYVCGEPRAIPIEDIIERGYGISIEYHHLRKNMTTIGQMIFDGGHVPVYDMESQSYTTPTRVHQRLSQNNLRKRQISCETTAELSK